MEDNNKSAGGCRRSLENVIEPQFHFEPYLISFNIRNMGGHEYSSMDLVDYAMTPFASFTAPGVKLNLREEGIQYCKLSLFSVGIHCYHMSGSRRALYCCAGSPLPKARS